MGVLEEWHEAIDVTWIRILSIRWGMMINLVVNVWPVSVNTKKSVLRAIFTDEVWSTLKPTPHFFSYIKRFMNCGGFAICSCLPQYLHKFFLVSVKQVLKLPQLIKPRYLNIVGWGSCTSLFHQLPWFLGLFSIISHHFWQVDEFMWFYANYIML